MEEIRDLLKNLLYQKAEQMDDNPLDQEMMDYELVTGEQECDDCDESDIPELNNKTPPSDVTPTARRIPKGSTVRRRLFADDGPAKVSENPNMINSTDDVDRMMQEEVDRAAKRWSFDIQREEPIPNGAWTWLYPGDPRGEIRKRRLQEAEACSRELGIIENAQNKLRKLLDEDRVLHYISSIGVLDNLTNTLMDDSQDYYAESVHHWNFDFDNKMPAAGAVVWQQVGSHWVGNKPATFTRLVLYPTETEKGVNTSISDEVPHEELTKADESAFKPTDEIEHLFTEHVNAIYGDWKREMTTGIKTATIISSRRNIDRDVLEEMRLLQTINQHHQISKSEAIAMIRDENINQKNGATLGKTTDSEDDADEGICEDNNSTPKKSSSLLGFVRDE